jgi:hypothetical protein
MALPSSGQISFNDVRTETSQSAKNSYAMSEWTWGMGGGNCSGVGIKYAPINVLSSGSRFSISSPLQLSNLSMSAWYSYDHNLYIPTEVTGTLYSHADYTDKPCPTTMLPIELGTTNSTFSINISGSTTIGETVIVFYGKPWRNNADDAGGFSVKGSSITNFTEAKSIQKKLRKPEVILPEVASGGKVFLRNVIEGIRAVEGKLSGRINGDTILLRVIK